MDKCKHTELLEDMRCQVIYGVGANIPIPLYERIKEALGNSCNNHEKLVDALKNIMEMAEASAPGGIETEEDFDPEDENPDDAWVYDMTRIYRVAKTILNEIDAGVK